MGTRRVILDFIDFIDLLPLGPALGPSGLLDVALHALRLRRSGHVTHATVIE